MPNVIKHGKLARVRRCRSCQCVFSYTKKEVLVSKLRVFHNGKLMWKDTNYINCPECNTPITLKEVYTSECDDINQ